MGAVGILLGLLPAPARRRVFEAMEHRIRRFKEPRMGPYHDANGGLVPLTRAGDTCLFVRRERIAMGRNVFIGHYSIVDGTGGLEICEGVQTGPWVCILSHSSHLNIRLYGRHYLDIPESEKKALVKAPVRIGRYSFLAAGAIVLPGVQVGMGALVAAGSVAHDNVEDFAIVAGTPAKKIGDTRELDKPHLDDVQLKTWYEEWQNAGADSAWTPATRWPPE
jgi:acetyltransferase-like isoleucine patch superfamily enzyme